MTSLCLRWRCRCVIRIIVINAHHAPLQCGPLGALLLLTPLVYDQTRVLAIAVLPLAYRCWLSDRAFLGSIGPRNTGWLAVAWAVVPVIFVLGARPYGSVLPYSLALLSNWITGSPPLPADLGMWPFP